MLFVILRWTIATVFLVSGLEKCLGPYQNFLYVVQQYELFPSGVEQVIARIFPFIELFIGIFLLVGLWTKQSLQAALIVNVAFILVVGQALIRQLPIDQCGCFGELIHVPLAGILLFDTGLLALNCLVLWNLSKALRFSMDARLT